MANNYFNHIANRVQAGTRAIASNVNAVADEISVGLDLLPTENQLKLGLTRYAVDTGVADAYILTMPYTPTLTDGFNLSFKAVNANTGPSTINVNGLGVKAIVNPDGGALIATTFGANAIVIIAYESIGDRFILVSQNPAQAALAEAQAIAAAASAAAALVSEGNAATSESNAAGSAGTASTDAGTATTRATQATTQASIATTQASAALATRLLFEQSYLGSKASDPTLDNEGNALIDGALYWNTTTNQMNVYDLGITTWGPFQDGGNAATVGGIGAGSFLRSDADDTFTGIMTVTGQINVDNLTLNLNTISAASGGITLTAFAGSAVSVEGVSFDGGVVTGASAITATNLTGTLQTAAQANVTSLGTLTNLQVDSLNLNGSVITGATSITSTTFVGALTGTVTTAAQPTITSVGTLSSIVATSTVASLRAAQFTSNIATRTVPVVEIINDNATGNGGALKIQQDQAAPALEIVQSTTGGRSIFINASSTGANVIDIDATAMVTGFCLDLGLGTALSSGGALRAVTGATGGSTGAGIVQVSASNTSNAVMATASNVGNRAGFFVSSTASRTAPIVEIRNNSSTGTGVTFRIEQDQSAPHIELDGVNGEGIKFVNAQASTDVNTLDDYEEGEFTVTITPSTSGTITLSGTEETLAYTKIGRMVFVTGEIQVGSVSSPVGILNINTLPFACATLTDSAGESASFVKIAGLAGGALVNYAEAFINEGVTTLKVQEHNGSGVTLIAAAIQAATTLTFSFMYMTTA